MINNVTRQAEDLLKECLKELETSKGSISAGVHKLLRAAKMLGDEDVSIWCEIQLGSSKYTGLLSRYASALNSAVATGVLKTTTKKLSAAKEAQRNNFATEINKRIDEMTAAGLKQDAHFSYEEVFVKTHEVGGGYRNIGEVERIYDNLIQAKSGNDGTFYQAPLSKHISYVKRVAHEKASHLYNKVAFSNTPQTSFEILKAEVEGKLLDIAPEATEKLMVAFRSVASSNPEEWSQALTTCRRFIEDLADALYPSKEEKVQGRSLGKAQYINRLWAFMDESIESESNRELAKAHVNYLGSYLERTHKLTNKGVHADLGRVEAVKAVFHTYLMVADMLGYLRKDAGQRRQKLNIHTATLDELESVLRVSRNLAKEIVKLRVEHGIIDSARLKTINGVGPKTISLAEELLSFEPVT